MGFDVLEVFPVIHRPDLFRTGYQNQAIFSLEQGQVCEGPATHPHPRKEFLQPFLSNNLDSTCVLIVLQVCFYSAIKHGNAVTIDTFHASVTLINIPF